MASHLLRYLRCAFFFLLLLQLSLASPTPNPNEDCYCFPGESCWPTPAQWAEFNRTVDGRLIATTPIGSVCHVDNPWTGYNVTECNALRANWDFPHTHYESSSSVMAGLYANQSCDPFLGPASRCIVGTYVQYAVRAESAADIQQTLAFTRAHHIRIVVRNTGHDYLGKSTGAGAVAIWTHHLKTIDFLDEYRSPSYRGPAVRVGAGVQIFEANAAASRRNLTVVGGNCRSVGLAGGYSQGGGHGQLVSRHGLAADQVLEWEVVTATGDHLVATPHNRHADLYWALAGGGGGTYAVVLAMTSRAHRELPTAAATLAFAAPAAANHSAALAALAAYNTVVDLFFNSTLGPLLDARGAAIWELTAAGFSATPLTLPGGTQPQLQRLLDPMLAALTRLRVPYTYSIAAFPTFYTSFETMSPDVNISAYNLGGRLLPRRLLDSDPAILVDRFRSILASGAVLSGVSVNASRELPRNTPPNAVNPAWRDAAIDLVIGTAYSETNTTLNTLNQQLITDTLLPPLEELTPGGGAYLNEADAHQPDWQHVFYGENYAQLCSIKRRYDPEGIFYARTAVGSES
ncbi:FAD-dependent oxidoreductase [Aspergillus saccharolyticus JOP 1030-1]|uniref:FAD/FMN-containing dehydrogenase n=1 Tax=Aspergillus saccharolyticus JOP 1030-1 TaxID=1450539 RepID=A0A318ZR36_9EURO|nr:FAD/FMN-containing dehydrogenase [Aspergillus saccharolyticus JOP 1030-1]PYH42558.1 FAD/FMN-containing dehydrogenase [Aspergillus saccharolyticus JOP 1030-1]